jgi:hypothetical protein
VAGMLADAKERARLPILANVRVATPCRAEWNEMAGDERMRHCASCDKDVFNLSSMTRDEAEALIVAKAGELCVRYYQRKDGTILLADCQPHATRSDAAIGLAHAGIGPAMTRPSSSMTRYGSHTPRDGRRRSRHRR